MLIRRPSQAVGFSPQCDHKLSVDMKAPSNTYSGELQGPEEFTSPNYILGGNFSYITSLLLIAQISIQATAQHYTSSFIPVLPSSTHSHMVQLTSPTNFPQEILDINIDYNSHDHWQAIHKTFALVSKSFLPNPTGIFSATSVFTATMQTARPCNLASRRYSM